MRPVDEGADAVVGFHQVPRDVYPDRVLAIETERVVHDVLRAWYGSDAVRSVFLAARPTRMVAMPSSAWLGIKAARAVAVQAGWIVDEYVRIARGDGISWADLAEALGIEGVEDPGIAAYNAFTGRTGGSPDLVRSWRCRSCEGEIVDHGPSAGHPDECERGHAESCARHRAEVAAYETGKRT